MVLPEEEVSSQGQDGFWGTDDRQGTVRSQMWNQYQISCVCSECRLSSFCRNVPGWRAPYLIPFLPVFYLQALSRNVKLNMPFFFFFFNSLIRNSSLGQTQITCTISATGQPFRCLTMTLTSHFLTPVQISHLVISPKQS